MSRISFSSFSSCVISSYVIFLVTITFPCLPPSLSSDVREMEKRDNEWEKLWMSQKYEIPAQQEMRRGNLWLLIIDDNYCHTGMERKREKLSVVSPCWRLDYLFPLTRHHFILSKLDKRKCWWEFPVSSNVHIPIHGLKLAPKFGLTFDVSSVTLSFSPSTNYYCPNSLVNTKESNEK